MRVAYLGPPGSYSEEALIAATQGVGSLEPIGVRSFYEAIASVAEKRCERAFVAFENSIEGTVRPTLDALAFDVEAVAILGQHDHPIHHNLIAREAIDPGRVEMILSHPQASAQCARFCRETLPGAEVREVASTSEAVRQVAESSATGWAALGGAGAAERYGCKIVRAQVEDHPDNVTRFIWVGPEGTAIRRQGPMRTTLVFSELGDDHPGALVEALLELSARRVNLTRIESRPLRRGLGRYMFFIDIDGADDQPIVADALAALRLKAESVRILGSYPIEGGPPV